MLVNCNSNFQIQHLQIFVVFSYWTGPRKEKNKLASRACRLKKKAQHEANKLKLHGLQEEHRELSLYFLKRHNYFSSSS